ncbi:MAG: tRNA (adenosine(37)-N6)-dimethylallyltransferase MiaA [Omnitrophica bacterium RIFCSPHIGHO2_02_FULL_63_14]|nr:MAG: tRNA (adenosine(37)-N6)-dimethylallyltransferase MiaA [Omnitrophica bacterium RIFCSPHIGHO2_02_FULL_63_14]
MAIRPGSSHKPPLIILAGPTGSGKTDVARELSKRLPIEMISCDSMQVYKGLPIVTQAPRAGAGLHLVSCLDPSREFSAAAFRSKALKLIPQILERGRIPLICGGTGLYVRALLDGLFETGRRSRDEAFRKKLLAGQAARGGTYLHDKLRAVDPASARRIHPNDLRRIVRALEVRRLTGRCFSEQRPLRSGIRGKYDVSFFLIDRARGELYERIDKRVERMLRAGLLAEVRGLCGRPLSRTASAAIGIRQIGEYLDGRITKPEAVAGMKQSTRNYAKRQLSWFRHEKDVEPVRVAAGEKAAETAERILSLWKKRSSS